MKVYVVTMYRWGNQEEHSYVLGVWSNEELALLHGKNEESWLVGKYEPKVTSWEVDANEYDNIVS